MIASEGGEDQREELPQQKPVVAAVERRESLDGPPGRAETDAYDLLGAGLLLDLHGVALRLGRFALQRDRVLAGREADHAVRFAQNRSVNANLRRAGELYYQPCHLHPPIPRRPA